jgi:uncharacterized protein YndB with AHSA1/START domain
VPTLQKSVTVKAPVDKVFKYIGEPQHLPEIWPSLFEVMDVKTLPTGGHTFAWNYNMAGNRFKGTTKTFEWVPYERIVDKTSGDIESTFAWTFHGENGFTKIEFEADYTTPTFFDKKEIPFIMRRNELEADTLLNNLKARFES